MKHRLSYILLLLCLITTGAGLIYMKSGSNTGIAGIVVPHHDLVKVQRQAFMAKVAEQTPQPETIILVSPNHYEVGVGNIQMSRQTWETSGGAIQTDQKLADSIASLVTEAPGSFSNEHGIKAVLPDIKTYFPQAKIVTLILKARATDNEITKLNQTLAAHCTHCLMVASVDFSHYQPPLLSNVHDDLTIRALTNLDTAALQQKSEVDSPAALNLLAQWAKTHNAPKFHVDNHTNSSILSESPDQEATSHVFGWYQSGQQASPPASVSFTIGGSVPLQGLQTTQLDQLGDRVFWGTDASIASTTDGPGESSSVAALRYLGLTTTLKSGKPSASPLVFQGQQLKLQLIHAGASTEQLATVRNLHKDPYNRIVVIVEDSSASRQWIDAGADLVVGSSTELYKERPIIDRLGVLAGQREGKGLILSGEFKADGLYLFVLPSQLVDGKPSLVRGAEKKAILERLYDPFAKQIQDTSAGKLLFFSTQSK